MTSTDDSVPTRFDWVRWGVVAIVVLPIVTAVARAIANDWVPIGDVGLLGLRIDDVGSRHHPWLGSWTSASLSLGEDINNPGAWYAYLAAPFVAVFGTNVGIPLAVGALNVASVVATSVAARALGGVVFERWMLVGAAALSWSMGSELLIDLWQPHALMLPLFLLLVLAAGVAAGRSRFVAPLVVVTSLVVQTHLGHAYMLALVGTVAMVAFAVVNGVRFSPESWPAPRAVVRSRAFVWSVVGAFVMWLPALIEQLINGGEGNLWRIATNTGGGDVTVGAGQATRIVARVFAIPPFWSRGSFQSAIPATQRETVDGRYIVEIPDLVPPMVAVAGLGVLLAVAGALIVWAQRSGRTVERGVLVIVASLAPVSVVSLAVLAVGPVGFAAHHARWTFVLASFVHAAIVWAAIEWARERWGLDSERTRRVYAAAPLALVALFAVLNLPGYAQDAGPTADRWAQPTLREIDRHLDGALIPEPVMFDADRLRIYEPYSGTVMMWLGEDGVDFTAPGSWHRQVGDGREADGDEVGVLYQLEGADALLYAGEDCVVFVVDGVDDSERERLSSRAAALTADLIGGAVGIDRSVLDGDPSTDLFDRAIAAADDETISRLVYDGIIHDWALRGALDDETTAVLAADGDAITRWVRGVYGLYLATEASCPA